MTCVHSHCVRESHQMVNTPSPEARQPAAEGRPGSLNHDPSPECPIALLGSVLYGHKDREYVLSVPFVQAARLDQAVALSS